MFGLTDTGVVGVAALLCSTPMESGPSAPAIAAVLKKPTMMVERETNIYGGDGADRLSLSMLVVLVGRWKKVGRGSCFYTRGTNRKVRQSESGRHDKRNVRVSILQVVGSFYVPS